MTRRSDSPIPAPYPVHRLRAPAVAAALIAALLTASPAFSARARGAGSGESAQRPTAEPSDPGSDPSTIDGYVSAWVGAVRAYDVDRWAALVDEDVVMMAPNGRVVEGRAAFRELWVRSFEGRSGTNPLHVEVIETRVGGDTAVLRADYGPIDADPVGQYVWVLERGTDGRWSMAWWIFNRKPAG